MKVSVKIMRSYDYSHFEVELGSDEDLSLDQVNDLRKQAAVLVDEAVRQYKIAKDKESRRDRIAWEMDQLIDKIERLQKKEQSELTVEEVALLRSSADQDFWKEWDAECYMYEDGERDHHFSMLRRFKDVTVKA